jgi:hypothetical protein
MTGAVRPRAELAGLLDALAKRWSAGSPTSAIGEALGLTAGQVAGLISRARVRGDDRFAVRQLATRPRPAVRLRVRRVKSSGLAVGNARPRPPIVAQGPKPLSELTAGECHFPINDAAPGEARHFLFCGKATAAGAIYCGEHARVARPREPRVSASPAGPVK